MKTVKCYARDLMMWIIRPNACVLPHVSETLFRDGNIEWKKVKKPESGGSGTSAALGGVQGRSPLKLKAFLNLRYDGENLSNLRFADDVALLNETTKQMEKHLNNLNSESLKVGLKTHKGKTKYMTNYADSEDILIDQQKIEKVTEFKYLEQTTHLKDTTKEEIYARIRAAWSCFGKNKEILQDKQLPISLKKQVMDQCILPTMTYGCQTCSLNKQMTNKLRTAQRAMERKMLDLKLKDKIPCSEIRKRTKVIDIIEYTLKQKWKWAGHIAR